MDVSVYLTNLAQYNNGCLIGKWLNLPLSEDELHEEIKAVLGTDEEYFITDYEAPFQIEEYDNLSELNRFTDQFAELCEYDQQRVVYLIEAMNLSKEDALEHYEDVTYYQNMTLEEVADELVEEGIFGTIPDNLLCYLDSEKIARDLSIDDYHETSKGVFHYA